MVKEPYERPIHCTRLDSYCQVWARTWRLFPVPLRVALARCLIIRSSPPTRLEPWALASSRDAALEHACAAVPAECGIRTGEGSRRLLCWLLRFGLLRLLFLP